MNIEILLKAGAIVVLAFAATYLMHRVLKIKAWSPYLVSVVFSTLLAWRFYESQEGWPAILIFSIALGIIVGIYDPNKKEELENPSEEISVYLGNFMFESEIFCDYVGGVLIEPTEENVENYRAFLSSELKKKFEERIVNEFLEDYFSDEQRIKDDFYTARFLFD